MNKHILSAAAAIACLMGVGSAHAADGQINFTGSLIANTCVINGGNGNENFMVALPPVSANTLATAGSWAGRTAFQIKLTQCSADQKVATYFEPGPTVNGNTGRLIVDAGGAKNVELGLLNDSFQHISLGAAVGTQNSQVVDIKGGNADLNYFVQYESTGVATAGTANSRIHYTMIYQ